MRTLVALAAAVGLAVAACSGGDGPAAALPSPTTGATATAEPPPTAIPTETPTAVPTADPTPTSAPAPSPTARPSPTVTPTPEPAAQAAPTRTASPQPTPSPTAQPTATPSPTATPRPTATPTPTPTSTATPQPTPTPTPAIPPDAPAAFFDGAAFSVELALTSAQQSQGLSDRESLAPGTGMLFVFAPRTASSFWMLRMRFPIDIVWISEGCAVVDITVEAPAPDPDTPTSDLPTYSSSSPAGYVLEINAGKAAEHGIEIGDVVRFANVSNPDGQACP